MMYLNAIIKLLETSEGGRQSAIKNGYRPVFGFVDGTYNSGQILIMNDSIEPGSSGRAMIQPLVPENWNSVRVEDMLRIYEGKNIVGYALVTGQ